MWIGVRKRFKTLEQNLLPDGDERDDVQRIATQIAESLSRSYYDENKTGEHFQVVGSRLKETAVKGISDIDLYYAPPDSEFERFNNYNGNGQSAFLQDIKNRLTVTYPQTKMRGDNQVVVVSFNSIQLEVSPAHQIGNGAIHIPYAADNGKWIKATPFQELSRLNEVDIAHHGNVRKFIRGVKAWADYCNVPLKGFQIEVLVSEFAPSYYYNKLDEFWFDYIYRDFFAFLLTKKNLSLYVPATNEYKPLGEEWYSRAETAYNRSLKACEYEHADDVINAGHEWQKIFGDRIPIYV